MNDELSTDEVASDASFHGNVMMNLPSVHLSVARGARSGRFDKPLCSGEGDRDTHRRGEQRTRAEEEEERSGRIAERAGVVERERTRGLKKEWPDWKM